MFRKKKSKSVGNVDNTPKPKDRKHRPHSSNEPSTSQGRKTGKGYLPSPKFSDSREVKTPGQETSDSLYVALHDFSGRGPDDLPFRRGEKFSIIGRNCDNWWKAKSLTTSQEGYIPINYIEQEVPVGNEKWYFNNTSREQAEMLLKEGKGNIPGTFLVRNNGSGEALYSLSILDPHTRDGRPVKHYRIFKLDNGRIYISRSLVFDSLRDLVDHYSVYQDNLCYKLTQICQIQEVDIWAIKHHELKLLEIIGKGCFGEVWKGHFHSSVAVKRLLPGTMKRENFIREAEAMKKLRHPNLLSLYAVIYDEPMCIVTELMSLGSLRECLLNGKLVLRNEYDIVDIAYQISCGMEYIEANNYIHRDLRAANVLVNEEYVCKVGDFGLARLIEDEEYKVSGGSKFPYKWTAPESLTHGVFNIKSDVWSYGILLHEIVDRGALPYPVMSNREVFEQLIRGYRMPQHANCPNKIYELMLRCWDKVPNIRPTFADIRVYLQKYFEEDEEQYLNG